MKRIVLIALLLWPLAPPLAAQTPPSQRVASLDKKVEGTSSLFFLDGRLWTCNDHGRLCLYALDTLRGRIDSVVDLGVKVFDLEEVTQDDGYLYFGDFGDNRGVRNDLRILRLAKQDLRLRRYRFDTIRFTYPDRKDGSLARDFDCEAFVAVGDSLYLFTKQWVSQGTTCYALPKAPGRHKARRRYSLNTRGLVTAASYHSANRQLLLLGYTLALNPFVMIVDGLDGSQGRRLALDLPLGTQSEVLATTDCRHFFLSSETFRLRFFKRQAALFRLDLSGYTPSR